MVPDLKYYLYYYYKIGIAYKFKQAWVRGNGVPK